MNENIDTSECPGCEENENHLCNDCDQLICEGCFCHENHRTSFLQENKLDPNKWEGLASVPHPLFNDGEFYFKGCFPKRLYLDNKNKEKITVWMKLCEELGVV